MASVLAKSLLGIVSALVVPGALSAQVDQLFKEGVQALRLGQRDVAAQKFAEVLKLNPSHEDAFRIWRETETAIFQVLALEGGDFEKIANYLIGLATVQKRQLGRDEATIAALVADATGSEDFGKRRAAALKLFADHGEYAVPALVEKLGNADDDKGQNYAILTLHQIGKSGVFPLIEALGHANELVRRNVAATLAQIGDARAAAALAHCAQHDGKETVREIGKRALASLGVDPNRSAVDLYVATANAYLSKGVRDNTSEVVWQLQDGKLVAIDTPPVLFAFELAKRNAHAALGLEPANAVAQALVARVNLAESAAIAESLAANPKDEALAAHADKVAQLRIVAAACGVPALRQATVDSIEAGMVPVAVAGLHALGDAESRDQIAGSPLLAALDHSDKRIRYAAALALSKAAGNTLDQALAGKVVANLGEAVTEEALRVVKVVDGSPEARRHAVEAAAKGRGTFVDAAATITKAAEDLLSYPNVDVVVLNETQTDGLPETLIGLIKNHSRMANVKILVVAKDAEAAKAKFGDRIHGAIAGPLTGDALLAAVNQALEGSELGANRARADAVAIDASNALADLADRRVAIGGALANLSAQLNRQDAVALPAAHAIGSGGSPADLGALCGAVKAEGSSLELKIAATHAIGAILGRAGEVPAPVLEDLFAIATSGADIKLRAAAAGALGKGKLTPGDSLRLIEALKVGPAPVAKKPEG